MSRELNDDFDEDDLPAGNLDLDSGSAQVGTGVKADHGGGDGIDFDDDLADDSAPGGPLELDMPTGGGAPSGHGTSSPPKGVPPKVTMAAPGSVPDLAMPSKAPPRSSGSLPAGRPSGQQQAVKAPPPPPASEGHNGFAPPPPSSRSASSSTMAPDPHSSGQLPSSHGNGPEDSAPQLPPEPPPPAKPTPAALIAKYPIPPRSIANAPMYAIRVVMRQFELRTDLESLRRRRSPDVPLYEAALRAYDVKTFRLGMAINLAAFTVATFIFFLPVILRFMRD